MRLPEVRRALVVLLVAASVAGTGSTARAAGPGAPAVPEQGDRNSADAGRSHRPEIGTAVTIVRNADGSVTTEEW